MWGRLLYDPATPDAFFAAEFERRYGPGLGAALLEAQALASNMPLRLASFHRSTWDYTLYSEGFISAARASSTGTWDNSSPFISILEFIDHETLDPSLMSIPDFTASWLVGESVPDGVVTPLALADSSENDSLRALELVGGLMGRVNEYTGALKSELDDIATWAYLGLYLADKLRAGVELDRFRSTGNSTYQQRAVTLLNRGLEHWDNVIDYTKNRYVSVPHVALANWTAGEYRSFSWDRLRPDVVKDIEIARSMVVEVHQ